MKSVFLETSALLRVILSEPGRKLVLKTLREANRIVSSRLIKVESERALIRLSLDHAQSENLVTQLHRDLQILWSRVDFVEISKDICERAGRIAPRSRLRTLDAIHLASYYRVKEIDPSIKMLSYDDRIRSECSGLLA